MEKCHVCAELYPSKYNKKEISMKLHKYRVHGIKPEQVIKCGFSPCSQKFFSVETYNAHFYKNHKYICSNCSSTFGDDKISDRYHLCPTILSVL